MDIYEDIHFMSHYVTLCWLPATNKSLQEAAKELRDESQKLIQRLQRQTQEATQKSDQAMKDEGHPFGAKKWKKWQVNKIKLLENHWKMEKWQLSYKYFESEFTGLFHRNHEKYVIK